MEENRHPLHGVFEDMERFEREAAEKSFPASATSLTAVRKTNPALAKTIFTQAVIEPARQIFKEYGCSEEAFDQLEEIETRFRQENVALLFNQIKTLVASRLIWQMHEVHAPEYEKLMGMKIKDEEGKLKIAELLDWNVNDVLRVLANLANLRERRIQILLTAAVAGKEALEEAVQQFGGYKRGAVIEAVFSWLSLNGVEDEAVRRRVTAQIAEGSDEQIAAVLDHLIGCTSEDDRWVRIMLDEIFTGEEHIEF